jgi:hypothetical protein
VTDFVASARCRIDGPAGALEALYTEPPGDGDSYAVVCHPHPLFGGTMENKVVTTLARSFQQCGMATVRFNFRGVGQSEGSYAEGGGIFFRRLHRVAPRRAPLRDAPRDDCTARAELRFFRER